MIGANSFVSVVSTVYSVWIGGQLVAALLALPEAAPVAADVPVAQLVIDELLRLQAEGHQVVVLERLAGRLDQQLQVGQDPAVDVGALAHRHRRRGEVEAAELLRA